MSIRRLSKPGFSGSELCREVAVFDGGNLAEELKGAANSIIDLSEVLKQRSSGNGLKDSPGHEAVTSSKPKSPKTAKAADEDTST
jgi:hypothetical protein